MFEISLLDAGILPAMIIALVAGIFSFLSPCVLPIVPPYLAYMGACRSMTCPANPAHGGARSWRRCSLCWG